MKPPPYSLTGVCLAGRAEEGKRYTDIQVRISVISTSDYFVLLEPRIFLYPKYAVRVNEDEQLRIPMYCIIRKVRGIRILVTE